MSKLYSEENYFTYEGLKISELSIELSKSQKKSKKE